MPQNTHLITKRLQPVWDATTKERDKNQWVSNPDDLCGKTRREIELKDRTIREEKDVITKNPQTENWMLTRNNNTVPIITTDMIYQHVTKLYLQVKSNGRLEARLGNEYAGIIRTDLRVLLKALPPSGSKKRHQSERLHFLYRNLYLLYSMTSRLHWLKMTKPGESVIRTFPWYQCLLLPEKTRLL
jgi:hypothetical protein